MHLSDGVVELSKSISKNNGIEYGEFKKLVIDLNELEITVDKLTIASLTLLGIEEQKND